MCCRIELHPCVHSVMSTSHTHSIVAVMHIPTALILMHAPFLPRKLDQPILWLQQPRCRLLWRRLVLLTTLPIQMLSVSHMHTSYTAHLSSLSLEYTHKVEEVKTLTHESPPCMFTPTTGNIHQLKTVRLVLFAWGTKPCTTFSCNKDQWLLSSFPTPRFLTSGSQTFHSTIIYSLPLYSQSPPPYQFHHIYLLQWTCRIPWCPCAFLCPWAGVCSLTNVLSWTGYGPYWTRSWKKWSFADEHVCTTMHPMCRAETVITTREWKPQRMAPCEQLGLKVVTHACIMWNVFNVFT